MAGTSYAELEEKLRNYERLLIIVTQEKDLALEMVRTSAQKVGQLEEELSSCEDKSKLDLFKSQVKEIYEQMQKDYSEAIVLLEKKLACVSSDLHVQAKKVVEKNGELEKLQKQLEELSVVQESLKNMETREEVLRGQCRLLEAKCIEYQNTLQRVRPSQVLEDEVDRLTQQLHLVEQQRNELQTVLEKTQNSAEALAAQEAEARNKVSEAITIVETTLVEKQQAQHQLMLSENECKRLQKELIDIIEEAGVKVKKEVEEVRKSYQDQLQTVQSQMNLLEKEKNKRINQIENLQAEITRLEKELDEVKRKSVSPRKLQALNEQLHATEANLLQLQVQNKSLNEIIMQNQHRFESEISKCGIERRFLEKQILQLQADLTDTGGNLERAVEHCNQLSEHLQKLSSDLINERAVKETDNTELLKQLKITRIHSNSAMQELKKFVTTHNDITNRWKEEYLALTEKFNEKMKQLKLQNKLEKRRNKKLVRKLICAKSSHEYDMFGDDNVEDNDEIDDTHGDSCDELLKPAMNDNNVHEMHGTGCSCNE